MTTQNNKKLQNLALNRLHPVSDIRRVCCKSSSVTHSFVPCEVMERGAEYPC